MYSVISVKMDSLPGKTENRESSRSWLIRVRFLHRWADVTCTYAGLSAWFWLSSTTANRHLAPTWWVGGAQPRKEGAQPHDLFWWFFVDFWKKILVCTDLKIRNFKKLFVIRDRETQYFEAVSSRGKEWCVEVPSKYCHWPVRSLWAFTG